MPPRSAQSTGRLVGLLAVGILFLAGIGLFGMSFGHEEGQKALSESVELSALLDTARTAQVAFKVQVQDWKNFLIRGHAAEDREKYVVQFAADEAEADGEFSRLLASPLLPESLHAEIAGIRAEHARLGEAYRAAMEKFQPSRTESTFEIDATVRGIDQALTLRIDDVAGKILSTSQDRAGALVKQFEDRYRTLRNLVVAGTLAALVLLGFVVWSARAAARA